MKNMKIKTKLVIGFAVVLVLMLVVAGFAAVQLGSVSNRFYYVLAHPAEARSSLRDIEVGIMEARRIMNRASMYATESDDRAVRDVAITGQRNILLARQSEIDGYFIRFNMLLDTDQRIERDASAAIRSQLNQLESAITRYINVYIAQTMDAAREGDTATTISVTRDAGETVTVINNLIDSLRADINGYMDEMHEQLDRGVRLAYVVVFALAAVGILAGILVALWIANMISKPINNVVTSLEEIAKGKLNVNLKVDSTDEVGMLNKAALDLVTTLQSLMDEMEYMASEQAKGQLDVFIDERKFENSFADVAIRVNEMIKTELKLQRIMVDVFSKIADGEFDTHFDKLPGQLIFVNEAVEAMRTNIKRVSAAISSVIVAAADDGDLAFKVDTAGFHDGWLDIMNGLNHICEEIDRPVVEVRDVMSRLMVGDFNKKVTGNYNGDFKAIAEAVNGTIDALNGYISEMSGTLSALASGDLTRTITRDYAGDFSEIKRSINHISETFYKTVSEITAATDQVLSGAKQISQSAMDLANGAQSQASSVEELNASVDLINQQTRTNAESAELASDLSTKSTASAQEGNEAMKQMLDAMGGIRESSNSISRIIKTITDIAFQTNLLSLNASVEAARAGEHGRGFAVVADEVRVLATRSQDAATETTDLIQGSVSRVDTGSTIANSTAVSLDAIVSSANEIGGVISKISEASREQADAIDQISIGLQQISNVVQSNSAVSEETAAAAEELNSQAEILQQLVSYFRL